ncbi:helix-turn-helix transcriptional regulator [Streptomyces sp. SID10853]|uniref:helix-turn-helix domain-containing protein n=1 Tax=Streptomyces sp. SID10853 TaxID=2706028 RepID=UPI0013C0B3FC|nr:helix-turn-helix transcriptional regulator [Streptomyces sp. SID10853]NDZ78386.1 helix-turn-helix transcriptional regulator [Streptomyces sp. SID10853]
MPSGTPLQVGRRIAATRHSRRMTQADLARAAFISLATVKAIERGARAPSDTTLDSIAAALTVDPTHLVTGYTGTERRVHAVLPELSAVLAAYDVPLDPPSRSAEELRAAVTEAVSWRLAAQYARVAQHIAPLLQDSLYHLHSSPAPDAARLVVAAARTADAVACKYGAHDLSARLIDLMRWAAEQSDDALLSASVAYVRTETFFVARAHRAGLRALESAVDMAPQPVCARSGAARGALHMRAAVIAGRAGEASAADTHLSHARALGDEVREDIYGGTAFGPDSVRIHEVSVAVSLGGEYVSRALDVAREWKPSLAIPAERRSGFYIELARAQLWSGLAGDAFESLKVARSVAPQHTREHPWAKEDTATLRRLKRADADSLTNFAEWIGAI